MKDADRKLKILFLSNRGPLPIKDGKRTSLSVIVQGSALRFLTV